LRFGVRHCEVGRKGVFWVKGGWGWGGYPVGWMEIRLMCGSSSSYSEETQRFEIRSL
jgi:hypothetical protein